MEGMVERVPMTQEGYDQAEKKLYQLKNVERPRVEKALGEAREMGDLSENAEFDAAREELWNLDRQIGELEQKITLADVVDESRLPKDTVAIGATLEVEDVEAKAKESFMLVGEGEIRSGIDTVSVGSPLGHAFIGHKTGDIVEVQVPRGVLRYKIISFKYA